LLNSASVAPASVSTASGSTAIVAPAAFVAVGSSCNAFGVSLINQYPRF